MTASRRDERASVPHAAGTQQHSHMQHLPQPFLYYLHPLSLPLNDHGHGLVVVEGAHFATPYVVLHNQYNVGEVLKALTGVYKSIITGQMEPTLVDLARGLPMSILTLVLEGVVIATMVVPIRITTREIGFVRMNTRITHTDIPLRTATHTASPSRLEGTRFLTVPHPTTIGDTTS